ncbi:MAG: hypothetical protein M3O50_00470 [Myxococcota bacterium]|nr:hypothetical protein [Myxococcota bacterium]
MATKKTAKKKVSRKAAPAAKTGRAGAPAKNKTRSAVRSQAPKRKPVRKTTGKKGTAGKGTTRKSAARPPAAAVVAPRRSASSPAAKKGPRRPAERKAIESKTPRLTTTVRRRDRPGHVDPKYGKELLEKSGGTPDGGRAFVERRRGLPDDLAEQLGEEAVAKATTGGEDVGEESLDQVVPEEVGGPFVESTAEQEFAAGTDPSNPADAEPEPFPTT